MAFVTGSISAPGLVEALEHNFPKDHPLRPLFVGQAPADSGPRPTVNLLLRHGVRSCLEYSRSGDIAKARALTIPIFHRIFLLWIWAVTDMPWFGSPLKALKPNLFAFHVLWSAVIGLTEARSYRVVHRARLWQKGQVPGLRRRFWKATRSFRLNELHFSARPFFIAEPVHAARNAPGGSSRFLAR